MTEHSPTLSEDQGSIPSTAQTNKQTKSLCTSVLHGLDTPGSMTGNTTVKMLSAIFLSLFSSGAPKNQNVGSVWFSVWNILRNTLQEEARVNHGSSKSKPMFNI